MSTPDARDREIDRLSAENKRLREALERIGNRNTELSDGSDYARGWNDGVYAARTVARLALEGKD